MSVVLLVEDNAHQLEHVANAWNVSRIEFKLGECLRDLGGGGHRPGIGRRSGRAAPDGAARPLVAVEVFRVLVVERPDKQSVADELAAVKSNELPRSISPTSCASSAYFAKAWP